MNELTLFRNQEFGSVRTTEINGKPYFMAADVANALGYSNARKAVSDHCKGVTKRDTLTNGGVQPVSFIPESDVYRLIIRSKLPGAERFEAWVVEEVLPTIRKTGGYVADESQFVETYLPFADETVKAMFTQTLQALRSANQQLEEAKPKVIFADAVAASKGTILIGDLAKILRQNGVDIGQQRLFDWLRQNGFLIRQKGTSWNMPTQRSMEMGLFEVKETAIPHSDGHVSVSRTTKVTGKGQQYFVNAFLRKSPQTALPMEV